MPNEAEVHFGLFGEFDPDQVSLGVAPTRTRKKGVPGPKHSSWEYSTGKVRGEVVDVYEMASGLARALEPHTGKILEAKRALGLEAVLEVVLTFSLDEQASTPAVGFESHVISFLDSVGASIDVDTYRGER